MGYYQHLKISTLLLRYKEKKIPISRWSHQRISFSSLKSKLAIFRKDISKRNHSVLTAVKVRLRKLINAIYTPNMHVGIKIAKIKIHHSSCLTITFMMNLNLISNVNFAKNHMIVNLSSLMGPSYWISNARAKYVKDVIIQLYMI